VGSAAGRQRCGFRLHQQRASQAKKRKQLPHGARAPSARRARRSLLKPKLPRTHAQMAKEIAAGRFNNLRTLEVSVWRWDRCQFALVLHIPF
jgi:hypothetical protein